MTLFHKIIKRFTEWEFWPAYMFYLPNLPYALFLTIKARDLTFYTAVNPAIKDSGNGTESKFATLSLLKKQHKPISIFIPASGEKRSIAYVLQQINDAALTFPLIVKPDTGFRGLLVQKINNPKQLTDYLSRFPIALIIQEYIDYPNECGVLYSKLPNSDSGQISSLTLKSFLSVKGNGFSTLEELVMYDKRAIHYLNKWKIWHADKWHQIPGKDEYIVLSIVGNHTQGTQFINGNHLIDKELTRVFDHLTKDMKGWHYGRFDIKYKDMESLKQGKDFIILEINGIISEPTHIYDPVHISYLGGLKVFRQHWKRQYQIAMANKKKGIKTTPIKPFVRDIIRLKKYIRKIKHLSESPR